MAAAQALGIVLADRLAPSHEGCWIAGAALLAIALALAPRAPRLRAVLIVAACLGAGAAALAARLADARTPVRDRELTVEATLGELVWQGERLRADLEQLAPVGAPAHLPRRVRIFAERTDGVPAALQAWRPGERWRLRVRLRPPAGPRNPGRSDPAHALARRGIGAVASLSHPGLAVRIAPAHAEPMRRLWAWRSRTAERLAAAGPGGPLLAALALGERGALSHQTNDAFARLGLTHLLSVSGLHLSLAAGLVFGLARATLSRSAALAARRDARTPALALALLAAWIYAAITGFAVPVRRAAVLVSAAALSLWSRRARRPLHPLALASLWVLAAEPAALLEPGFQLSFGATAMLILAGAPGPWAEPEASVARRLLRGASGLVRTSALALLATTPLVAWHFGRVEPAGLLCNLLAIPVTGFALLPASALGVLAACVRGPWAEALLAACEAVGSAFLAAVVALAERLPAGAGAGPLPLAPAALAVGLAGVALLRPPTPVLIAALAVQALVLARASPPAIEPAPPRVVVLDVGQGDAVLVQGRRGVLLVDAGPLLPAGFDAGADVVLPALRALGVRRLDRLALSHGDLDHRGGAPALLAALPVGAVWLPPGGRSDPTFAAVREAAEAARVPVLERAGGGAERIGDLAVEFLWPPAGPARGSANHRSLVLRVEVAGRRVLLPGDVEAPAEAALLAAGAALAADLVKLPHHGSRTSSSDGLLTATGASLAIASAPCRGRFGMPHPEVRARLERHGLALAWTGRDGAILVGLGPRLRLRTWGSPRPGCGSRSQEHDLPVLARESR